MRVNDLQNGQVVRARLGRYVEGQIDLVWSAWTDQQLHVQRDPKGRVSIVTPKDCDFAEFDPRHDLTRFSSDGTGRFEAEGYYMEIEGLEP